MAAFGFSNEAKRRGTLNTTNGDRVHIRYTTGAKAWVTPTVAHVAIERGQARLVHATKMVAAKKK
ncbi:MAG: hypothetical protein AAB835_01720 [Patescibacteria group bacterium]